MGIFSGILDVLFPPKCVFCGKVLGKGEKGVCARCKDSLPYAEGAQCRKKGEFFSECVAPLFYEGDVRESILRFKFKGATGYASEYGKILADCIRDTLADRYDIITWTPVSSRRKKDRGYDQAMLLACAAALELDDVAVETLKKHTDVPAQSATGSYEKRKANISGVYCVPDPELIAGKRVLVIDDIVTTGATLSECARTLLTAGAEDVVCAALARDRE